ncbi:nose resistant to fluoxetine protein 6-like isoform X2 [Dinothrombium tinctorium]|uniref:Nose resistant to fluoxetine protein 6-like isoform X2 n=1 Tax=Dinothrombium tinctorium TaxID=1965070 RepID=A0A3S3QUW8_9ACAR|nr:nose resistant to fluoxetine protein 6-like isoform X2 [Dinothrombium tinctorium]
MILLLLIALQIARANCNLNVSRAELNATQSPYDIFDAFANVYGSSGSNYSMWEYNEETMNGSTEKSEEQTTSDELMEKMRNFIESYVDLLHESAKLRDRELNEMRNTSVGSGRQFDAKDVWLSYGYVFRRLIEAFVFHNLQRIAENVDNTSISSECALTLLMSIGSFRQMSDWIVAMIDASGKPLSAGTLEGTITDLGSFDQCLAIKAPIEVAKSPVVGQFCLLKYSIPLPPEPEHLTLQSKVFNFTGTILENTFMDKFGSFSQVLYQRKGRLGICVPSTCTPNDIQKLVDLGKPCLKEFEYHNIYVCLAMSDVHVNALVADCSTSEAIRFTTMQIIIFAAFGVIAALVLLGTAIETAIIYKVSKNASNIESQSREKSCLIKIILSFSAVTNGRFLFSTETFSGSLDAVNGVKVLSMAWILYTHTYLIPIKESFAFAKSFVYSVQSLLFQLILNGWVLVDSFFFIGALLSIYTQLHSLKKKQKINFIQLILHRFFRFSPLVWFTILLMLIIPSIGSGPLWKEYFIYQEMKCKNYWWSTVLFINNWFPENEMCLLHTWYLSADFQMFIFATIFIIPLFSVLTGLLTYIRRGPPTVIYNTPSELAVNIQATSVYTPTYSHLGPYCIGIIFGYLLFKKRNYRIKPLICVFIWCISIVAFLLVLLSTYYWNIGYKWSPLSAALYSGTHRLIWSLSVAWVCFACVTGNGGPINKFLSWKLFIPLSKLGFSIYLMHFLIVWLRYAYIRERLPFSHYTMFCEFVVNFALSIVMAAIAFLAVEAPSNHLYKMFLSNIGNWSEIRVTKKCDLNRKTIKYLDESIVYRL